jgi:hypothetical protein
MTRIDLHTHSTVSDGTDTPHELMHAAASAGLDVIALTDHDATAGWADAARTARTLGITLVPGIELTTMLGAGIVHVLGYLFDPRDRALVAETDRITSDRVTRAQRMVELINQEYPLAWNEVLAHTEPGTTVGRPHIADALVAKGHIPDRATAFTDLLGSTSRFYVPHYAPDPLTAVKLIRAAGGVPVIAHPATATRGWVIDEAYLTELTRAGLFGLEVDHRENTEDGKAWLKNQARIHGLATTGSSDYHGTGKPNRLGENLTSPNVLDQLVAEGTGHTLIA